MTCLEKTRIASRGMALFAAAVTACGGIQMSPARPPGDALTPKDASETAQRAAQRVDPTASVAPPVHDGPAAVRSESLKSAGESGAPQQTTDELVVDRTIVLRCPNVQRVRDRGVHGDSEPPVEADKTWLVALQAIAECMSDAGALAHDYLGVSGDEEHRHLIRQVLSSNGIAPTRVVALRIVGEGAAECQGAGGCAQPVVVTIAPSH